ncbi:MAG: aminotransferase class I/II-fold pyridoxal phosphate-dependent enzyme [Duncaniella sp.]|nr:aminotransferase class I/II-fold pyridoxal phosphate-dependent enzyme [Duncaniella sp.]
MQPYITGSPESAVTLSGQLLEEGFKVLPIRTPTVPPGTDRLRISLSAALSTTDIDSLGNALTRLTTCN